MRVATTTQTPPSKSTKEHRPKTREKMRKVQQKPTILLLFCQKSRKSEVPKFLVGLLLENPKKKHHNNNNNAHKINTNSMAELATQEVKLFGKWSFDDVEVRFSEIRVYLCSRVRGKVQDFRYFFLSLMWARCREG